MCCSSCYIPAWPCTLLEHHTSSTMLPPRSPTCTDGATRRVPTARSVQQSVLACACSCKPEREPNCFVACSFDISAWAGPLDVVHYTVDREDPSDGLCLSMTSGAWQGNMLMNQPNPQPTRHGASAAEKNRYSAILLGVRDMPVPAVLT